MGFKAFLLVLSDALTWFLSGIFLTCFLIFIGICLSHFFACFGFLETFFAAFLASFMTGFDDFFLRFGHLSIDTGM